jgi:hypothetical protein
MRETQFIKRLTAPPFEDSTKLPLPTDRVVHPAIQSCPTPTRDDRRQKPHYQFRGAACSCQLTSFEHIVATARRTYGEEAVR